MTKAQIIASLNAWKAFFVDGKNRSAAVENLDTLATLARQSGDAEIQALGTLCAALEAAWMNGARQVEAELAD